MTLLVTVFLFLAGEHFPAVNSLFTVTDNTCFEMVLAVSITITFVVVLIFFFNLLFQILSGLKPIVFSELDYEAIDEFNKGKEEKAYKILIKDMKNVIDSNQEAINEKYNVFLKVKSNFTIFLFVYMFLVVLVFVATFYAGINAGS